jgi:hypothetical protein
MTRLAPVMRLVQVIERDASDKADDGGLGWFGGQD